MGQTRRGGSAHEDVLLDLLGHLASTSAYQRLRSEQQLGYIVFAFVRRVNGAQVHPSVCDI